MNKKLGCNQYPNFLNRVMFDNPVTEGVLEQNLTSL